MLKGEISVRSFRVQIIIYNQLIKAVGLQNFNYITNILQDNCVYAFVSIWCILVSACMQHFDLTT